MIPKQIFFIWFGDIPNYCNYSINAFKKLNPDFKIDLIHYSIDDVVKCDDSVLKYCKDLIFKTKKGINNKYFDYINHRIKSKFNFIQILSDFLRFELLYYYGGIYLDCDIFPNKTFDNNLLNRNCFGQQIICFRNKEKNPTTLCDDKTTFYDLNFLENLNNYHYYSYTDIYFIGSIKEYKFNLSDSFVCNTPLQPPWIRNLENTEKFKILKDKFYNNQLKLGEDFMFYSQYITHYCNRGWQNNFKQSKMYCEYDDYLYGK